MPYFQLLLLRIIFKLCVMKQFKFVIDNNFMYGKLESKNRMLLQTQRELFFKVGSTEPTLVSQQDGIQFI